MQPASSGAKQLAQRLRKLRQQWPDARLTQEKLATAFSAEDPLASVTVSSWESLSSPKAPPRHRLQAYARFFATPRSIEAAEPRLLPLEELTSDEEAAYKKLEAELLRLRGMASADEEEVALRGSWRFTDDGRVTFVCAELPEDRKGPLAKPSDPNYTELQAFADLDALMELHGHIRAENPLMHPVHYRIPASVVPDDLTGHVILVGGVVWNTITRRLSEMARLPITQLAHSDLPTGEIFVAEVDGKRREFWPKWAGDERKVLEEDVGLFARVPNPLNSNRTLTICNGIHSKGVYGAVRSLTDAQLRDGNERYIAANFGNSESFAILMSVKVIKNQAMTPDFRSDGVVLYQWPQDIAA
jgi:hypothetical protein